MNDIQTAIISLGGRMNKKSHVLLCHAIEAAGKSGPEFFQMQVICLDIARMTGNKSSAAVYKALSRAVADLWETGNCEALASFHPGWAIDRPTPKEFISVMAMKLGLSGW